MKLAAPANENYAATVVRLPKLLPLAGCDNLVGAPIFGFQAIVSNDHAEGDLGIVFPAECQLSLEYASHNNLHRHGDLNKDEGAVGYLEDNRRIRAIKLRGHRSDCLFMPIESLSYLGVTADDFEVGDTFDTIGDHQICQKYIIKTVGNPRRDQAKQVKRFIRVDPRLFPEHLDTANYWRNAHLIDPDEWVYVTQKVHGTSWRGSRSLVLRKLRRRDRIARRLGVHVDLHEWDAVAGSRKVIKDPHNPDQQHFYTSDIWTAYLERVQHLIPEGFIVYGELIGWTPDNAAIQTNYTYGMPKGTHELFVYRVAMVNPKGVVVDLSWPQVRIFCNQAGLRHVPDLWEGPHKEFVAEDWIDRRFADDGHKNALPLDGSTKLVDEGVCIRADRLTPIVLKAKSPIFLAHETKLLDKGETNLEDEGSTKEGTDADS